MIVLVLLLIVLVGVHLASTAYANRLRANPDPYPIEVLSREPDGDEIVIERQDGTKIRAISAGEGPTVVLAHGYGYTLQEWNVVWSKLRQAGCRVIAFDQRGHGQSTIGSDGIGSKQMAGDYRAVLEHFDVRDAVLVGHSMGGFVSIVFLLEHPVVAAQRLKGSPLPRIASSGQE